MPLIPELERIIKQEETALSLSLILSFLEAGLPFWTEVEIRPSGWLFAFLTFRLNPNFCLWFFINCATRCGKKNDVMVSFYAFPWLLYRLVNSPCFHP